MHVACVLATLVVACDAFALDNAKTPLQALQELGGQIKLASDQADVGRPPSAASLADLEHALGGFRDASTASNAQFQNKYQAVALLFGKLKYQASHPQSMPAKPTATARAQTDVEVVSEHHGAGCETALGISESLPVRVTLTESGNGRSDAWFRFDPDASRYFSFRTASNGADPTLEVYRGACAENPMAIASNDDDLGLDAQVAVRANKLEPLFVHLTNSGQGGSVLVSVDSSTATISGTVTDKSTGSALVNVQISLMYGLGYGGGTYTDQNGNYSVTVSTVNAGPYYLRADNTSYVSELYPDASCLPGSYPYGTQGCDLANAVAVPAASGDTVTNINFGLDKGQRILGQVRDTFNRPIAADVTLADSDGNPLENTGSDAVGHYSFATLPPGNYKLVANYPGYGSQMYAHIACDGNVQSQCDLSKATPVAISSQDVIGINFDLPQLASIHGTVSGTGSQPLSAQIALLDNSGGAMGFFNADSSGHYVVGPVAPGSYYVTATANGYFPQIYDHVDCGSTCVSSIPSATAIQIVQAGQSAEADFDLHSLPVVRGHVEDAVTGLPLGGVIIEVGTNPPYSFQFLTYATTDNNGNYELGNIPPGAYYLWAQSNDHIDQIYPNIPCESFQSPYVYYPTASCSVAGAVLLTIAPGQSPPAFDFTLTAASTISGAAIARAGVGSDLPANVVVLVYDTTGKAVAAATSDSLGDYAVGDLPPGTYFAIAQNYVYSQQYVPQLWQQIDCPNNCVPTTSTPIALAQSATVGGIDFQLVRLDAVVGRVTNEAGAPVRNVIVDVFDSSNGVYQGSGVSDANGFYAAPGFVGGAFFVATEAGPGYYDQVDSGISCPMGPAYYGLCSFTNASAIALSSTSLQPHIVNFVLQSNDPIFANDFE